MMRTAFALLLALALSACAGGSANSSANSSPRPGVTQGQSAQSGYRPPQGGGELSLSGTLGARTRDLIARLGPPRIDLAEGDARKLQFASSDCVLDIFLYPGSAGSAPVATYVEARERTRGAQTPSVECLRAIERQGG